MEDEVVSEAEALAEGEQAEAEAEQTIDDSEVTRYTVKVRGQEQEVDLDELISGYQRQADYTRGTQELAEAKQQLEAAEALWNLVHNDPKQALEAIEEHFAEQLTGEPPDERDQRLRELEEFAEEQRQQAIEAQVASEIRELQKAYEDDFDGDELLEYAIEHKIGNLEAAYLHRAKASERAGREKTRQQAKRTAPPVAGGSNRSSDSRSEPDEPINSVQDAVRAALKEHKVSSLI